MVSERRAFGARLKVQRERCGVSLQAISRATKVPASLFDALERGDCSRWPGGIYARAYFRAYAEAIGLNGATTLNEFSCVFGGAAAPHQAGTSTSSEKLGNLRLSMAEEPVIRAEVLARRAALAAADLVIGFLIAAITNVGLGLNAWVATAGVLAYFVVGRVVSDDPLLYWVYLRLRLRTAPLPEGSPDDVPVGDAASTTA